jgi:arabinose-5-phosphate isomerase
LNKSSEITRSAIKTLQLEADAIANLTNFIGEDFEQATRLILRSKGRVVITGIGKSANIANKIVATLNSTGTPAIFMHAADAIHGDLGNVQKDDVVVCISKSGNTPEITALLPLLRNMGNSIIAMVGNLESDLARGANHILNTTVSQEACPHNLAPTTSTAAQLAMGDALAIAIMEARGFSEKDFAKFHPGGALGKRLYTTVGDLVRQEQAPKVEASTSLKDTILEISRGRLGATAVIKNRQLEGIVTDGDLRRMLENGANINELTAADVMTKNPKTLDADALAVKAFEVMEQNNITQIVILQSGEYLGIVHLHEILKAGIF